MPQFDPTSPRVFVAFGVLATCYLLAGAFFWLSKSARLKRTLLPYIGIILGALFLAWPLAAGFPLESLYTFLPLVLIMVWVNIRTFQFCEACGSTVRGGAFFSRPKHCAKCGAALRKGQQ